MIKYQVKIKYNDLREDFIFNRFYSKKGIKSLFNNKYSFIQSYLQYPMYYKVKIVMVKLENLQEYDDINDI